MPWLLVPMAAPGICLQARVTRHSRRYATMTGKGLRPRVLDLGPWRSHMAALFILYIGQIVLLPFLVLLWSSFHRFCAVYAVPSMEALRHKTLGPHRAVLGQAVLLSTCPEDLEPAAAGGDGPTPVGAVVDQKVVLGERPDLQRRVAGQLLRMQTHPSFPVEVGQARRVRSAQCMARVGAP